MEGYKTMVKQFQKVYPNWTGAITPETSVKMMLDVIYKWEPKDTGAFVSHHGNKEWL